MNNSYEIKSEIESYDKKSNCNQQNGTIRQSMHGNSTILKSGQSRKATVHDIAHVVAEDSNKVSKNKPPNYLYIVLFNKLLSESHLLISKYHSCILNIGSSDSLTIKFCDELKLMRRQTFHQIMAAIERLIPQFDQ
jgi:hypothetical protein